MNKIIHFLIISAFLLVSLTACKRPNVIKPVSGVDYYTCTMHPSVHLQDPHAKCPICSMDLVPVMKAGVKNPAASQPSTSEFTVPVARQQQIGVTYAAAVRNPLHRTIRAVGTVVADKSRQWSFVARVDAYVQSLKFTSPGEVVKEGQPLLTIYSPDLLTAERELINLLGSRGDPSTQAIIQAARQRLKQWNISDRQIAEIENSRAPSEYPSLNSPFDGIIESVPITQGQKVSAGDILVSGADLSTVWVWADFYEDESTVLAKGQKVTITTKADPDQQFEGEVSLISPFVAETTRTAKVRVDIANPELKLKPGMYVNADVHLDLGEGLTIPTSAVLPTGTRSLVFVDKGEGKLEPRYIQLGGKYGDIYEVRQGLEPGERVVSSANFLIDAESKVQGAIRSFAEPVEVKIDATQQMDSSK